MYNLHTEFAYRVGGLGAKIWSKFIVPLLSLIHLVKVDIKILLKIQY